MRLFHPNSASFLLLLAASALASPAAAQSVEQESVEQESETGRFAAITGAAQSFSVGVGQWLGFGGSSGDAERTPEPSADLASRLSPELMLEAFPALSAADDDLRLRDISREHSVRENASGLARELDLSASYVWELPRFGQLVLSTNTTYVYNTSNGTGNPDAVRDSATTLPASEGATAAFGMVPELQSSLTFTWQIGNHTATAVTSYTDGMDSVSKLGNDIVNIEQLNELIGEIATLDLRYGYNVKAGRQGNASISVGVRSQFDRRTMTPAVNPGSERLLDTPGRVAYGTIKYQF